MTRLSRSSDRRLSVAALLVTTALSGGAQAQTAPGQAAQGTIEEIVVTATKQAQKLSDVPLSVTALSSETLEKLGATQFRDFANTVPGLSFTGDGVGTTQINLRGITTGVNVSPTVAVYVDEVPYGSSTPFASGGQLALDVGLFDINRVEVLRGPQGTLYGASTMGGLVKYVTEMPDPSGFSGSVQTGLSGTEGGGISYNGAGVVNIPLVTDQAALRVSGYYSHDGGYIDNVALGESDVNRSGVEGGKFDLLLKPVDKLSIRLTGFIQQINRDGEADVDYGLTTGQPIDGSLDQRRQLEEPFNEQFKLISGTVNYDFGFAQLASISSFQSLRANTSFDYSSVFVPELGGLGLGTFSAAGEHAVQQTQKFTQELRLSGNGPMFDWLVGGFYTQEHSDNFQTVALYDANGALDPLNLVTAELPSRYQEAAGFGTVTYHITDQLDLAGGVRYAANSQNYTQFGSGLLLGSEPQTSSSGSVATYLADLRYRPSDNLTAYARFATGYRPGGPNFVAVTPTGQSLGSASFNPDSLQSYELGLKASTPDRKYSLDAALYLIDWNDLQVATAINGISVVANASSAQSKGAELTLTAKPIPDLTLVGAFGFTDATLSTDAPDLGGKAGDTLPNSPKFTAAVSADYDYSLAGYDSFAGGTLRYTSNRVASFNESTGFPQYDLPAYTTVDLRTGVYLGDTRVQLYVKNLFDTRGELAAGTLLSILGGPAQVNILQPRTFGLTVSTYF